ncbi:SecY-interacting protein Syd [Paenibacillus thiaminolyticus]|uniref:SecY-interacting protein Syd n=1 Tax=Paenibacillus thiaminolyticus TaxID=49283 RepID=A0A3A3GLI2_PANTH|nr:SecY-interacting protein Syd [Paenibacillus thiaminolyticus]RJG25512.1 SecY-interacting protein Syd [Paenibacillus thiaminolyticus]
MGVQEALRHHFDDVLSYWSYSFGTLPKLPYDEAANPMLYQGEPDEEDYIFWKPAEKEKKDNFEVIEENLGLGLHPSIQQYFNSYWFLELQGFYHSKRIFLEPVEPDKDMISFFMTQKRYEERQATPFRHIQIGFIAPEDAALLITRREK